MNPRSVAEIDADGHHPRKLINKRIMPGKGCMFARSGLLAKTAHFDIMQSVSLVQYEANELRTLDKELRQLIPELKK